MILNVTFWAPGHHVMAPFHVLAMMLNQLQQRSCLFRCGAEMTSEFDGKFLLARQPYECFHSQFRKKKAETN